MISAFQSEYKDKPASWQYRRYLPSGRFVRFKRVLLLIVICLGVWVISKHSFRPAREVTSTDTDEEDLYFDKDLYAPEFAFSIERARRDAPVHPILDVFFVLNGLGSSDTNLVALACAMAKKSTRSTVHVAVLGTAHTTIDDYRAKNGFVADCPVSFHDARIDASVEKLRTLQLNSYAENAVKSMIEVQPRAIIYTNSKTMPKPTYFTAAIGRHEHEATVIELDTSEVKMLGWIADLSPTALSAWNSPKIDIVIDASSNTGSLNRLLKSISEARYFVDDYPLILINFDEESSVAVRALVSKLNLVWPAERLITRRRVGPAKHALLENWYPTTSNNFGLYLHDQHELSPYYYHYLKFMLLSYRYDNPGRLGSWLTKQYGISLMSLLDPTVKAPEALLDHKVDDNIVRQAKAPILWHNADLSSPVLFYPDAFSTLHEMLQYSDDETQKLETTAELLDYLVKPNSMVLMYPPSFDIGSGFKCLAKRYDTDIKIEDWVPTGLNQLKNTDPQLLNNPGWYMMMGSDSDDSDYSALPRWSELKLFDRHGKAQALSTFFRGLHMD